MPSVIAKRAEALQKGRSKAAERYKPYEEARNGNEEVIQTVAESWAERGEQHRLLAFQLAHNSLKTAARRGLPIEDWRDADVADKTARRNAGLDSEEGSRIQIGLALIETRLQAINLPKDTATARALTLLQTDFALLSKRRSARDHRGQKTTKAL